MTGHPDRTRPLVVIDGRDGGSLAVHASDEGTVYLIDDGNGAMVRLLVDTKDAVAGTLRLYDLLATPLGRDLLDMDGDAT